MKMGWLYDSYSTNIKTSKYVRDAKIFKKKIKIYHKEANLHEM